LGKGLAKKGHQVHFITYSQPTRLDFFNENVFYHEVDIKPYPLFQYPPYEIALASKMVDVVQHEKIDLLHVHYAVPHASAAYMAREILKTSGVDVPFITTLHGTDITIVGKDASLEPVVTFSINQSNGITAVSDDLRKDTYDHFNVNKEIKVIPNFIDLDRFKKQKKDHFIKAISPNGEKLIVHTSNFRKVKRVDDVIKVFNKVRETVPSKLLLVGDGPERNRIEDMCRDTCNLSDVRFLGKLEAVEEVLSVADLFIMPSEKESFGLAALEAMACEVPVISTRVGGLPELNLEGKTGFLCEVGDVECMAERAIHVLDKENLPRFKKAALDRAKEFDLAKILPMYEAFYLQTVASFKEEITCAR
jgi:N-acetyl-alpha-D-glucosaminyl L-malate synthase BshA